MIIHPKWRASYRDSSGALYWLSPYQASSTQEWSYHKPMFPCVYDGLTFDDLYLLLKHIREDHVTQAASYNFMCPYCGQKIDNGLQFANTFADQAAMSEIDSWGIGCLGWLRLWLIIAVVIIQR